MTQLVWFRNDLRTGDNPALTTACQQKQPARACFVVTPGQWQVHDWSPARIRFVTDHANALAEQLAGLDNKRIHDPGRGGTLPKGYPRAIVDLKESRKEAIARFQGLKD